MAYFVVAKTIVIPAVPITNPGNAKCQYLSLEVAKGKRKVPIKTRLSPTNMTHLRGNFCWRTVATPMMGNDTKPRGRL